VTSGKSAKINFDEDVNIVLNKAGSVGTGSIAAQQQSINRVTAGNSMDITPIVGGGGVVTVKVEVEVSANSASVDASTGVPLKTVRRRISSEIQIINHETIAIGGLFDDRKGNAKNNQIPILSQIPVIGGLFGNNSKNKNLRELIILITPHIRTGEDVQEVYLQASGAGN
jgi:general secretion pathway protein D